MKSKNLITSYRNLKLIIFESAITAGILSMSIMTPFYQSIGLNQVEISQSQIIFTLIMIVLDLPMGWVADLKLILVPSVVLLIFMPLGIILTWRLYQTQGSIT